MDGARASWRFGLVLQPGFGLMGLAGVLETLQAANRLLEQPLYDTVLLARSGGAVCSAEGVPVLAHAMGQAGWLDAVLVHAEGPWHGEPDQAASQLQWLRQRAAQGCLMGGVGTGAAWLAEAGLLRGHRATAQWPHGAVLAERHPELVVSQQLYELDEQRMSCAGHQASQDLLIAWLIQRHGERLGPALLAALGRERLRPREERQRLPLAAPLGGGSAKLAEAVALMEANLGEPLPTEEIARLVGVSRRQLERLFKQHLDALPSRWYLELRLDRARDMLRQTHQSILQIALSCGFASGPHFSNAYRARYGHTPREERSPQAVAWRAAQSGVSLAPAAPAADEAPLSPLGSPDEQNREIPAR
ncbi:GlxA family transcriptional regulator [Ideonella dechloratans]|uniref:GlxA family transcriptional regulator n=1 Tax=Ideonella dechloratans TaxID=36863 RepID=A0A643FA01_IDEDE|nr:GlxA family transcriptional regulator [Ideonella dechloratans]KAB0579346.1 GlxA family transcriptional regulator [Ideonella dechloratans]UFU09739.1 GlxA family transcriptional regulator [Ideonella dechloratans]